MTFCSSLNFVISCSEEKFNSLETALHFKIFFGTLADNQTKKKKIKGTTTGNFKAESYHLFNCASHAAKGSWNFIN